MASKDAAQLGDLTAFVESNSAALLRLAYVLTGQRQDAEDLVQETLIAVHRHWRRVARARHRDAYVRRMLMNRYLSLARRRRWEQLPLGDSLAGLATDSDTALVEDHDELWRALHRLPPRQHAVLVLRYYEDLDDQQISLILHCRPSTVRSLAARALAKLRTSPHLQRGGGMALDRRTKNERP